LTRVCEHIESPRCPPAAGRRVPLLEAALCDRGGARLIRVFAVNFLVRIDELPEEQSMDRRAFLKSAVAGSAVAAWPWRTAPASVEWRTYEVVTRIDVQFPEGVSRVWIPLPMADDTPWHRTLGNSWSTNASRAEVLSDGKYEIGRAH